MAGDKYDVYENLDSERPIGSLVVRSSADATAALQEDPDSNQSRIPFPPSGIAYAQRTQMGLRQDLTVKLTDDDRLSEVKRTLVERLQEAQQGFKVILLDAHDSSVPHMTLVPKGDHVSFRLELNDQTCRAQGLTNIYCYRDLSCNEHDRIFSVILSAAAFYSHLGRLVSERREHAVHLECVELAVTWIGRRAVVREKDPKESLIVDGALNVLAGDGKIYGFKIINNTDRPFYAALFYFGVSDLTISTSSIYSRRETYLVYTLPQFHHRGLMIVCLDRIASYYQPGVAKDHNVEHSVPARGELTIGYGSGGGQPRQYILLEGQNLDVGFLTLFLSTEWVDYSHVPQRSPFEDGRAIRSLGPSNEMALWDSICTPIIQRKVRL